MNASCSATIAAFWSAVSFKSSGKRAPPIPPPSTTAALLTA
jgi:hypothetical protein